MTELDLPTSAQELVPHRGTMLLIDELREYSPEFAAGMTRITSKNPFLGAAGKLDDICFVEILAQLAAAAKGYEARKAGGSVKSGYLAGINDFSIKGEARLGDVLQVTMKKTLQVNNITVTDGSIFIGEKCIASGTLKLYVAENGAVPALTLSPGYPEENKVFAASQKSVMYTHILNSLTMMDASTKTGIAAGEFLFDKDFPGFHGHFPGYPLLPGIVMIGMSLAVCEAACTAPMMLAGLERAKFSKQVLPGDTVRVEVSIQKRDDGYNVRSQMTTAGIPTALFDFTAKQDILNR